jgi:hypothetical protein
LSHFRVGVIRISAWVPLDSIIDKETLVDRFGVGCGKLPALPPEAQRYRITGGDPRSYVIPEGELAIVKTAKGRSHPPDLPWPSLVTTWYHPQYHGMFFHCPKYGPPTAICLAWPNRSISTSDLSTLPSPGG